MCCAKPSPIPCTLSSLLPVLLICVCLGNSYTQGIGVPGMLSSVKDALEPLGLVRSTQFIYLLFLLAPGMSFKRMQNNHFMTLFLLSKPRFPDAYRGRNKWMQKAKHTLLWLCVLWSQELLTGAEDASHDAGKTFEILADRMFNTLLKLVLSFAFHLLSLLWVFVWLLSSSGVQLALRGSAARKHIWEPQLALADSTSAGALAGKAVVPTLEVGNNF